LSCRGHTVLAGVRSDEGEERLRDAARRAGFVVQPVRLDVAAPTATDDLRAAVELHGRLDTLIHNAGVAPCEPAELIAEHDLRLAFETNVIGPILITQAALGFFRAQQRGRIVTVSSLTRRAALGGASTVSMPLPRPASTGGRSI
jgi:NAD(P)-dependent dehydrogenase (short-subunit alcohol dehydrogenase family)